jgi:hypothetical protein
MSIINSLPLLPQGLLDLFACARRCLARAHFTELFFDRFIWQNAVRLLRNSAGDRHAAALRRILDAASSDPARADAICDRLSRTPSRAPLPQIYGWFGHHIREFVLAIRDVQLIARVLTAARSLPELVTGREFSHVPTHFAPMMLGCQIYLRAPAGEPEQEALFAGVSPEMDVFFAHLQHKRELEKWVGVVRAAEEMAVAPLIGQAIARAPAAGFLELFAALRDHFNDSRLSRRIYLSLLDARSERLVAKGLSLVLSVLNTEFKRALKEFPAPLTFSDLTASLAPGRRPILIEAVRGLGCLDASSLHRRMAILFQTMRWLTYVQKMDEEKDVIYPLIFQQNKGSELLSTFLILNAFAMNQDMFNELCSDEERQSWLRLESVILSVLKGDAHFLKAYITMQERLIESSEAWLH